MRIKEFEFLDQNSRYRAPHSGSDLWFMVDIMGIYIIHKNKDKRLCTFDITNVLSSENNFDIDLMLLNLDFFEKVVADRVMRVCQREQCFHTREEELDYDFIMPDEVTK